jgi:aspartyl-tRNA synthetase
MMEFTKLREEVQKRAQTAKAASERKASREEMCKHITSYSAAELKWLKFTETGTSSCGIPKEVAQQLKQVHLNTEQTKEKICAVAQAPPPQAPSLSDALGTTRLPTPETTKGGNGTLDTLTGNAIQR